MEQTSLRWAEEGWKENHDITGMFWLSIISHTGGALLLLIYFSTKAPHPRNLMCQRSLKGYHRDAAIDDFLNLSSRFLVLLPS